MLTDTELRQAIFALTIIEERGDPDVFALVLREASDKAPAANDYDNMTLGGRLHAQRLASQLASLVGEPYDRCHQAATDLLGTGRQQVTFKAIIDYASELIGTCAELKDTPKPRRRPTVRLVAYKEGVA